VLLKAMVGNFFAESSRTAVLLADTSNKHAQESLDPRPDSLEQTPLEQPLLAPQVVPRGASMQLVMLHWKHS